MRILGIDPGYERLGIAIIEKTETSKEILVHSECFRTQPSAPFQERLHALGVHLSELMRSHTPHHVALENIFFNTNQKTALDVGAVRGVILYVSGQHSLPVFEYTPPQIKVAITGNGRASKKDVETMVHRLVALDTTSRLDDEYDAIAVALTHSAVHRK